MLWQLKKKQRGTDNIEERVTELVKNFYNENNKQLKKDHDLYINSLTEDFEKEHYLELPGSAFESELKDYTILILTANKVETCILHAWICQNNSKNNDKIKK